MDQPEQMSAVRWAFAEHHVVNSFHAHVEVLIDHLKTAALLNAGARSELLEDYSDRPEGHRKLLLGYVGPDWPVHIVIDVDAFEADFSEPIMVVTAYRPEPPEWPDELTRRGQR